VEDVGELARPLLSVASDEFVRERQRLARELRDEGRRDDAAAIAAVRKPPPVVLAANRAARSRPKVARQAARAASRMTKQLGSDAETRRELDEQLALLEEVALAFLVGEGKPPSEATRRRLHDLLRNAVADDAAREALAQGVLTEEAAPAGFASYSGIRRRTSGRGPGSAAKRTSATRRAEAAGAKRLERALRDEVRAAHERLRAAKDAERKAARERARAERALASVQAKLDRLIHSR
jgi:hypothetical protein